MTHMPFATLAILQSASQPLIAQLVMMGGIFAIFYFVLIRPQQNQRKQHEQAILAIKKGDRIVTAGGLMGEVQHIKAGATPGPDDEITIKSGESRLLVERGRIAKIFSTTGATSSADKVV
jgi:preprotein translocase subunit YajC